jgi:hypothetical protein
MNPQKGDRDSPGQAQCPPGCCPDHRSVTPFFASTHMLMIIPVCGDIHGQYVRGRVLCVRRCELTNGSMTT